MSRKTPFSMFKTAALLLLFSSCGKTVENPAPLRKPALVQKDMAYKQVAFNKDNNYLKDIAIYDYNSARILQLRYDPISKSKVSFYSASNWCRTQDTVPTNSYNSAASTHYKSHPGNSRIEIMHVVDDVTKADTLYKCYPQTTAIHVFNQGNMTASQANQLLSSAHGKNYFRVQ
jgi:hypothetical protein